MKLCCRDKFEEFYRDIGSGAQTSFWEEPLARGKSLKNFYSGLYSLVIEREVLVRDSVRREGGDQFRMLDDLVLWIWMRRTKS